MMANARRQEIKMIRAAIFNAEHMVLEYKKRYGKCEIMEHFVDRAFDTLYDDMSDEPPYELQMPNEPEPPKPPSPPVVRFKDVIADDK